MSLCPIEMKSVFKVLLNLTAFLCTFYGLYFPYIRIKKLSEIGYNVDIFIL